MTAATSLQNIKIPYRTYLFDIRSVGLEIHEWNYLECGQGDRTGGAIYCG
jgi:hypothetical protein